MASFHRARVCAVGSEADIRRMLAVMLDNCGYLEEPEDRPPWTLQELLEQVRRNAAQDGTENDGFLYEMISAKRFGDAEVGTMRLQVREELCGLWTATFAYQSQHAFQTREWLDLHLRCDRMLMVAQRASEDFAADKGEVVFAGGGTLDNWDTMSECWMWLMEQYECGYPPEEAVERLKRLEQLLTEEEYDVTVEELITSCMSNLNAVALSAEDHERLRDALADASDKGEFSRLLSYRHAVAEAALWETEHNAKWLACLETLLTAWRERS